MENLQEVKELFDLINIFNSVIPDGTEKNIEHDGAKIKLIKKDGVINVSITSIDEDKKFDDSRIKEVIKGYKDRIKELDDYLFVDVVEDMGKSLDIQRFNYLLDKECFTEEEALEVADKIDISIDIIREHLESKIQDLIQIYNKF